MPPTNPPNRRTAERRLLPQRLSRLSVSRAKDGDEERVTISGYGAVFYDAADPGTEYRLFDDYVERIMPGAFDRALQEDDVRSLFNHDPNLVLGRTSAGTLALSVDKKGLKYSADAPATQLIRDQVISPVERGDVDGSSFMFIPRSSTHREETLEGDTLFIREIHEVELWETGPVTFPAYDSTTSELAARDREQARRDLEAWKESRAAERRRRFARSARARSVQVNEDG